MTQHTTIEITGLYDLAAVAEMSFGHRDESSFDGSMRMAFCVDGGYAQPVGVVAQQVGDQVELAVEAAGDELTDDQLQVVRRQVARAISLDQTAQPSIGSAALTRPYSRCTSGPRDSGPHCSTRRTRQRSGR